MKWRKAGSRSDQIADIKNGEKAINLVVDMNGQRQEPDYGILSRPVPWERREEVPLCDPITPERRLSGNFIHSQGLA